MNTMLHDQLPRLRVSGLLAAADLGMQILANVPAFDYGASPNKSFDYIAARQPVLNNYPAWLAERTEANGCRLAMALGNPAAFADALERAADNGGALGEMGMRARRLAEEQFARPQLADRFVEWLEGAAA